MVIGNFPSQFECVRALNASILFVKYIVGRNVPYLPTSTCLKYTRTYVGVYKA